MMTAILVALALVSGATAVSTACGVNMVFTMSASAGRATRGMPQAAYLLGSLAGAALVGSILGIAGVMLQAISPAVAGFDEGVAAGLLLLVAIVLGLREVGRLRFRLPQRPSQVNWDALTLGKIPRQMFAFGLWLGMGFLTYSPYGGLHLLALACVLQGSVAGSILLFSAFGLARALTVIALAATASTWDDAAALGDRVAAAGPGAARANAVALAAVGMGAMVTLAFGL